MTFELKILSPEAVPRTIAKAERYRLLGEPVEAESICRDVLAVDPALSEAFQVAERLRDPYDDPLLRWNTCARLIMRDQRLAPATEAQEPLLLE